MNNKTAKKIRQLFRRTYLSDAEKLAEEHMKIIKPKPKWFPMWLWVKLLGIFLKIRQ